MLLFLLPADSKDHGDEYRILVGELQKYNPELLHKRFLIAISKSDLLDEELKVAIAKELPDGIPHLFISSVTPARDRRAEGCVVEGIERTACGAGPRGS